jgi:signal transduction histidine kinase/CheY-like chemotaxis protein
MSPSSTHSRTQLRRIVAAGVLAVLVVLTGVASLAACAVQAIDTAHRETETSLVARRVDRTLELLRDNVVSASVWNDACVAMTRKDWAWAQINFGDYYADYMKHDVTLAYGADGVLAYASRESEQVRPDSERAFAQAVAPLVAEVRLRGAATKAAHDQPPIGLQAVTTRQAFVEAGGTLYAVSAATIVPEDLAHASDGPFDPVVVSGRKVSAVVSELGRDLLISNARLTPAQGPEQPRVALKGPGGAPLAAITWSPARPGLTMLRRAAPLLLAIVGVLLTACMFGYGRVIVLIKRLERNEAARDEALARAHEAAAVKARFMANMSHELRTPLNGVIAVGEVLRDRQATDQSRDMAELIVSSARVLERLINDVLDTAKIEAGHMRLEAEPFVLRDLVRNVAELHGAAASAKDIDLSWCVGPSAAETYLGDQTRLAQVLSNLLSNAVKFTSRGRVRLAARPAKGGVRFVVSDTGAGFDQGDASRLFQAFEQADATTTRQHGGTGLGLAICRSLVELMGGRIWARSRVGRGSIFSVFVPLTSGHGHGESVLVQAAPVAEPPERPLRILLAEDHPTNQKVVAMILEPIGAELTIVDNGQAAVEAARAGAFDLILMDIQMPVMDGLEAMTLIRRSELGSSVRTPIICLTANAGEAQAATYLAAGGDLHLAKPYRAEALLQAVFRLLAEAEGAAQPMVDRLEAGNDAAALVERHDAPQPPSLVEHRLASPNVE